MDFMDFSLSVDQSRHGALRAGVGTNNNNNGAPD